jgi:hypothetical protein
MSTLNSRAHPGGVHRWVLDCGILSRWRQTLRRWRTRIDADAVAQPLSLDVIPHFAVDPQSGCWSRWQRGNLGERVDSFMKYFLWNSKIYLRSESHHGRWE